MKRIIYLICFLSNLVFTTSLIAGQVELNWQANKELDLSSYYVYYGKSSRNYGPPILVGKSTSHIVSNLETGAQYYFAVTAVDTSNNESGFSPEVKATAKSPDSGSGPTTEVALWWSSYSTRSTSVPVKIYDGSTLLDTVTVNQKVNGGKWNTLGSYAFKNVPKVVIVAKANSGSTCADAVRFTNPDGTKTIIDNGQSGTSQSGDWKTSFGKGYFGTNSLYAKNGTYSYAAK